MRIRNTLTKAVVLVALALLTAGGVAWETRRVRAGAPPDPDRLNFGMVGIVQGQSVRLNVVNVLPPSDLPLGPTRMRMTFVDGEGNQFTNPCTGNPVEREVRLSPGRAAFLLLNFDEVTGGDGVRGRRIELHPVVTVKRQDNDRQVPTDICVPTVEVIDNASDRTELILSALPAVQRSNMASTGE